MNTRQTMAIRANELQSGDVFYDHCDLRKVRKISSTGDGRVFVDFISWCCSARQCYWAYPPDKIIRVSVPRPE